MERTFSKILVTGANGFVGKNLCLRLETLGYKNLYKYDRSCSTEYLDKCLSECDYIFHLAGVNRPSEPEEFYTGNSNLTQTICEKLIKNNNYPVIVLSSSAHAAENSDYGKSKKISEDSVLLYSQVSGSSVYIFRFPGIFGKWCMPNYNSVVATFCHNISREIPISIDDDQKIIELVYIDDVCKTFTNILEHNVPIVKDGICRVSPTTKIAVGELAMAIKEFHSSRKNNFLPDIECEFNKNLYSTYLSYLPMADLSISPIVHSDSRGIFSEIFKTHNMGQISFSTTKPGITRGHHWHSTKTEKFVVLSGTGVIRMRNIYNTKTYEYELTASHPQIVDIPPGFTHSITNIGTETMITLIWTNELFDEVSPDTIYSEV